MKKQTFTLKKHINSEIKAGDKIVVWDGSGFTPLDHTEEELYIVCSYPELTGIENKIQNIVGEVIYTGIQNNICMGCLGTVYQQDIVIQLGDGLFRTCSDFVRKYDPNKLNKSREKINYLPFY